MAARNIGNIIARIEHEGLKISGLKMMHLSRPQAEGFYAEHKGKPFFDGLIEFMTSGPMCALVLTGENAIEKNREIMGATDPSKAAEGTLRALYACSMTQNAVHGSDSPKSAQREIGFFFPSMEIF